jgi:hypothetical protein
MFKKLKRFNTNKVRKHIAIELIVIRFSRLANNVEAGTQIKIMFEKKGKQYISSLKDVQELPAASIVMFDETIEFTSTLYKESSGNFMKKKVELQILQVKSNSQSFLGNICFLFLK